MTLTLRCIRCGVPAEMEPDEMYGWGLCSCCWDKHPPLLLDGAVSNARAFHRWMDRWQNGMERHPTYKALTAALERLEAIPPGTLDDNHDVLRAVMLGEPIT